MAVAVVVGVGMAAAAGAKALPMVGPQLGEAAAVAKVWIGAAAAMALGREPALVGVRALSKVAAGFSATLASSVRCTRRFNGTI